LNWCRCSLGWALPGAQLHRTHLQDWSKSRAEPQGWSCSVSSVLRAQGSAEALLRPGEAWLCTGRPCVREAQRGSVTGPRSHSEEWPRRVLRNLPSCMKEDPESSWHCVIVKEEKWSWTPASLLPRGMRRGHSICTDSVGTPGQQRNPFFFYGFELRASGLLGRHSTI
jgi:hypothetical protein